MEITTVTPVISINKIQELLKEGYTRTQKSTGYDPAIGCIQDFYGLDNKNAKALFSDERLKNLKTTHKFVPCFTIVEDSEEVSDAPFDVDGTSESFAYVPASIVVGDDVTDGDNAFG